MIPSPGMEVVLFFNQHETSVPHARSCNHTVFPIIFYSHLDLSIENIRCDRDKTLLKFY